MIFNKINQGLSTMAKANLENEKFGIEIEVCGASRAKIASEVAAALNGRITARNEGPYQTYTVRDDRGRDWKIMNDGSLAVVNGHKGSEIVTPVLTYPQDLEYLEKVVKAIKDAGGCTNKSASIHCHVSAKEHTVKSLCNLAKMVYKNEDIIFKALNVLPERRVRFAKPMDDEFINKVVSERPETKTKLNESWFGYYLPNPQRYESHRYRGLNLNNIFGYLDTIEYRYANSSLNINKIVSYIQLYLAMSVKARNAKSTSHVKINTDNPKFNFRVWLVSGLGMVGDEFKSARYYLTRNLEGDSAWR